MADPLRIGVQVDVAPLTALAEASAQVANSAEVMGQRLLASGVSAEEAASALTNLGYSAQEVASALGQEAVSADRAGAATSSMASRMGMARVEMGALSGSAGLIESGFARLIASSETLAPVLAAAFTPLALIAFGDVIVQVGEKLYHTFENVVELKSSIEDLDRADMVLAEHAARFNETYLEGVARRLEAESKFAEARAAFVKAGEEKPLELKIDDKNIKQFNAEFVAFVQAVHTSADAPSVLTRINAEADSTRKQLDDAKAKLKDLSELSGEALATGEGAMELAHASALVDDLTKKYSFLQGMIGEVQSQIGINALATEAALEGINKREQEGIERVARSQREAAFQDQESLNSVQELILRQVAEEIRAIEEVERKREEAARKAFDLAWKEYDTVAEVQADITREVGEEIRKREDLARLQAETDQRIQQQIDEQHKRAAEAQQREAEKISRQIERATTEPLRRMIEGTERVSLAFRQMGQNMIISVVEGFERMLIQQVVHEGQMLILHTATNQAKVASDAAAAEETKAISAGVSLKEVSHAAAAAAAKAYSALAEVPIVGPVLGAAAAAATFAGVMAFESLAGAQQGALVPRDMPLYAHAGEMVLPKNISESVQSMAERGGGASPVNVNWQTFDAKSLRDFLHEPGNQSVFTQAIRRSVRNGTRFR
jgi:hypothetical protein